ncbi:MAG: HDOD domain-containing protein [Thermodesulfobacteria bacterium]|nr:HDOD domain-containing protein [Thermodesulfobacteriota bacterium]
MRQVEKSPLKKESLKAEVYDMLPLRTPHNKILEVKKLPTLPEIAYRLLDLLSRGPEISQLEEVIRYDQSLTAKILSVANSAYFGAQKEIHSLERAIVLLGIKEVSEIAFSICVLSVFKPLRSVRNFDPRNFWLHSIATGITARIIAQALDAKDEDKFFTMGLLHDIGRVLLLHLFPEKFEEILLHQEKSGRLLLAEEMELGFAHTWIGRWLLKRWGLPESLVLAVRFHHNPFYKEQFLFEPAVIKLADMTVHNLNLVELPGGQKGDPGPLLYKLGLTEDLYQAILEHLSVVRESLSEAWSYVI